MKELGVGLVINCTSNISAPNWHPANDVPKWYRFPNYGEIYDRHRSVLPILPVFTKFYQVVLHAILNGMNVFTHCRTGAHRAGTSTAAYGMMAYDLTPCVQ